MARYIDVDKFEKYINREEWKTPDEKWWPERELGMLLDAIQTADVVEVVRCKDCAHYQPSLFGEKNMCFRKDVDGVQICYDFSPDDYCSYGERREE